MHKKKTAADRVLQLPELLTEILDWVEIDEDAIEAVFPAQEDRGIHYDSNHVLLCCSLVNKTWYHEAIPRLWRYPSRYDHWNTLPRLLETIQRDRRQFYANFIERATLETCREDDFLAEVEDRDTVLRGLLFPRLNTLRLFVEFSGDYIPLTPTRSVLELHVDPRREFYPDEWIGKGDMDEIFEQIVNDFPNLEKLVFQDYAETTQEALQSLRERLPSLKVLDAKILGYS